jgi:hypothetical protein
MGGRDCDSAPQLGCARPTRRQRSPRGGMTPRLRKRATPRIDVSVRAGSSENTHGAESDSRLGLTANKIALPVTKAAAACEPAE